VNVKECFEKRLLQETVHDVFKPLWADAVSEPGELGGVVGFLVFLDFADLP